MPNLRLGMAIVAAAIVLPGPLAAQQTNAPAERSDSEDRGSPNVSASPRDQPGSSSATTGTPPIAGANSFTEGQAKDRIAKAGYSDVKNLQVDRDGIWRAKAQKSGREVNVSLDYRGNIVQQ
jgi:hypothetical protein